MIIRWDSPVIFAKAVARTVKYVLQGRPVITPREIRDERMARCEVCPHRDPLNGQCLLCTCFVDVKTYLSAEECPDVPPRWNRLTFSKPLPKEPNVA